MTFEPLLNGLAFCKKQISVISLYLVAFPEHGGSIMLGFGAAEGCSHPQQLSVTLLHPIA